MSIHRHYYNVKQKEPTKKLQDYISEFSKVIEKYQLYVYTLVVSSQKLTQKSRVALAPKYLGYAIFIKFIKICARFVTREH